MPPQTAKGHEEPFGVQFSVFLANRVGQLGELLSVLAQQNLSVLGLSIVDSTDWAVIRLVLNDPNRAREVLRARYPFTERPVLLVCLEDEQSLARIFTVLTSAEVNVHLAYPLAIRHSDCAVIVLSVDEQVVATHVLTNHQFVLLGQEDMA